MLPIKDNVPARTFPAVSVALSNSDNAYLIVDQLGAAKGRYRLTVNY